MQSNVAFSQLVRREVSAAVASFRVGISDSVSFANDGAGERVADAAADDIFAKISRRDCRFDVLMV